jgi:hypothetical protein
MGKGPLGEAGSTLREGVSSYGSQLRSEYEGLILYSGGSIELQRSDP